MRHVPIAEFQDRAAELLALAEAGEEIAITRDGRNVLKLVVAKDREKSKERQRAAVDAAYALGQKIKAKYGPTRASEIRERLEEGRR